MEWNGPKRLIGYTTVVVALAFAGCSKPTTSEESSEAPVTGKEAPAATPTAKPSSSTAAAPATPAASAATAAPDGKASNLAPEGVFYLITAARIETGSGVQGLPPGTGVKRIRPGVYQTPIGEMALADSQLTNDMTVARAARDAAVAEQKAALARQQAAARGPATPPPKPAVPVVRSANAPMAEAPVDPTAPSATQVRQEIASLEQQYTGLQRQLDALNVKKAKEDYNRVIKGRTVTATTDQQIGQLQSQLAAVQDRISAAYERLKRAR